MAKVLFVNPVVREEDKPRHVPYGIALLAAIATEKGHLVQVFDQNAWRAGEETAREVFQADSWDVVALGGISTCYASLKKLVQAARELCPNATIILGGGVLTSIPREIMSFIPEADVGVIGEAFITFPEVLDVVDHKSKNFGNVKGLVYRDGNDLHFTPVRELIENLDTLPYPAWDFFPLEEVYFPNSQSLFSEEGMLARRRLDINGSYGCSLICRFCFHLGTAGDMRYTTDDKGLTVVEFDNPGNYTRSIRYHSPEYIVGLVSHAYKKYNIDFIGFLDENLMTMNKYSKNTWLKRMGELWIEAGLQPTCIRDGVPHDENCRGIHWSGTSHATLCDPEILKTMRNFGCSHLVYGYESFAPHVMKTIGKGSTPVTNMRSFFWTLDAGIRPIPNQIIGFPDEDFLSIYQNMEAWKKLGIIVKPFFATPYPGSEWFHVNRKSIEDQYGGDLEKFLYDIGDATRVTAIISKNFNSVELLGLRELMVNFNYRALQQYEKVWRTHNNLDPAVSELSKITSFNGNGSNGSAKPETTPLKMQGAC